MPIIEPKLRNLLLLNAHPAGCVAEVEQQIRKVKKQQKMSSFKHILIIGGSSGYGLSSRIVGAFGCGARTTSVHLEREPSEKRSGSAGYYKTLAFTKLSPQVASNINADAFLNETKARACQAIRESGEPIDMLIYSLAAPRRFIEDQNRLYNSVLKPIGHPYRGRTVDFSSEKLKEITIDPASDDEIEGTIKVMGGEDWFDWVRLLAEEDLLAPRFITTAFSYMGSKLTWPIYRDGTIGLAKADLRDYSRKIHSFLSPRNGSSFITFNKSIITQASSVIPVVPLYISALYRVMKEIDLHEGPCEQMLRFFTTWQEDEEGFRTVDQTLHLDDRELRSDVQDRVDTILKEATNDNINELLDLESFRKDLLELGGFGIPGIDYTADSSFFL